VRDEEIIGWPERREKRREGHVCWLSESGHQLAGLKCPKSANFQKWRDSGVTSVF
jgi:hypothetical protein